MKRMTVCSIAMLALAATPAASHSRLKAELACTATQEHLAYECTVRIADTGSDEAIAGLAVEVKADMPSMPMAHNIPPVTAEPADEPGVYAFPIKLDMFGNWAFSMRLSGPREDLLVEVLGFRADDPQAGSPGSAEKLDHSGCPSSHANGDHGHSH
jgi:hypothetical protein